MDPMADRMFCADCSLQSSAVVMQCDCVNEFAGKTSSSVNLSKHSYPLSDVSKSGSPDPWSLFSDVLTHSL